MSCNRRQALSTALGTLGATAMTPFITSLAKAADRNGASAPLIATNTYPWLTFARRANQEFRIHSDPLLSDIASTGITGYEPIIEDPEEFRGLGPRLAKHGLRMESIYVNSTLHEEGELEESMQRVLSIADEARKLGVRIIVTNPSPIRWGGTEDKNDRQLRLQAESLNELGDQLRRRKLTLAYHNHDAELRQGGREFHHMLTATDPANVKFCLDAHWIFRGCGNSEIAVFDALAHYHDRIVELHLRQSSGGHWTEAFAMDGDIDYRRLFDFLGNHENHPHLVLEQAVEEGSPKQHSVIEAHRIGFKNIDAVS